jgi:N-acetylmuramoyl-L-alanine amidase
LQGATVMPLDEPDPVTQAIAANQFGAHVYVGLESRADPTAVVYYYKVPTFESVGGRALAETIVESIVALDGVAATAVGMRLPVLRETRMPAALCVVGPVHAAADDAPRIIAGLLHALELWILRAT